MNQLDLSAVTSSIGLYPRAEELEQIQNGLIQLSKAINGGLFNAPASDVANIYIIWGCVVANLGGGNYSCTEGAFYYNGEIYPVAAVASVAVTGVAYKFGITTTYGTAGGLTDGTTTNDLVNKVGVFYGTTTPANTTNIFINGSFRTLVRVTDLVTLSASVTTNTADILLRELLSNKSTTTTLGTSDTLYPTQNAVKKYVDDSLLITGTTAKGTIISGNVTKSSAGGTITTFNTGFYSIKTFGKLVTVTLWLSIDLGGNWVAGDLLIIGIGAIPSSNVTNGYSMGLVTIANDGSADVNSQSGNFLSIINNNSNTISIEFQRAVTDPTGVNGSFATTITYASA